jgi:uroporphyrinogen-III synthase
VKGCRILNLGLKPLNLESTFEEVWLPLLQIKPISGSSPKVFKRLGDCDIVAFTSPRGPEVLYNDLRASNRLDEFLNLLKKKRVAAVGPSTAESLRRFFRVKKVLVPRRFTTRDLALLLSSLSPPPSCVLAIRSAKGSKDLMEVLSERGIQVKEEFVYDEVVNRENLELLTQYLRSESFGKNVVVLTSSLAAKALCESVGHLLKENSHAVVCLGPRTCRTFMKTCPNTGIKTFMPDRFSYEDLKRLVIEICDLFHTERL